MRRAPLNIDVEPHWGSATPPITLFVCVICGEPVNQPNDWRLRRPVREREPVCRGCTGRFGIKTSGPVFNRQNHHTLSQVKALINTLEWEIKNGNHRHR